MDDSDMNFGEICRTCLKKPTDFRNINEPVSNAVTLAEMIKYCTAITVDEGDLLPTNVCIECVKEVQIAYKFKTKTEKVTTTLREYLQAQIENFQKTLVKPPDDVVVKCEPLEVETMGYEDTHVLYPENMMQTTLEEPSQNPLANNEASNEGNEDIDEEQCDAELARFANDFVEYTVSYRGDNGEDVTVTMTPPKKTVKKKPQVPRKKPKKGPRLTLVKRKNYPCPSCPKRFKDKKGCIEHYRLHTGEQPYQCGECGRKFHRHNSYVHHITYSHTLNTPFECKVCHKHFKTPVYLRRHVKSCNGFGCENCKIIVPTEELLRQHQSFGCEWVGPKEPTIPLTALKI